jgi:Phosphoenolpyruvate carboxykinase
VQETGVHNGAFGADKFGLRKLKGVNWNFGAPELYEHALSAGEAVLSADGALCADTGVFTGRSPKDKFTVRDAVTDKNMWWAGNQSITSEQFDTLYIAQCRFPHRPLFRFCRADIAARRRAAHPRSGQDLGRQGRVRQDRAGAGRHVPEEFRQIRSPGRR